MTSSAHVQGMEWATSIFGSVERPRNLIVLSGVLDIEDLERRGINIVSRSWIGSSRSARSHSLGGIVDSRTLDRGTPTRQTAPVVPDTRYAKSGDIHIAYQVVGDGPIDLVFLPRLFSQVEHQWEEPSFAHFLGRLASFSRLIPIDARGSGLSDRAPVLPPLEEQMDDVLAVLDEVGSSSAAFLGLSQAGPMAIMFAASHPQ